MSYTIQLTHIPFKDNLKGKSTLLELNLLEAKINQLTQEKCWDILQVYPKDEELKTYLRLKDAKFNQVVDHLIDEFSDQYRLNITRILAFIALLQTCKNLKKVASDPSDNPLLIGVFDVGVMVVTYIALKAFQFGLESYIKANLLMKYRLDILVPAVDHESCAICIESVHSHEELVGHITKEKVKHVFHKTCIKPLVERTGQWFGYHCPLCRERVYYYRFKQMLQDAV